MNQTIGHIHCPICNTPGEVRRYKGGVNGALYWACECGQIRPVKSQRYILKNAEFYPDAGDLLPPGAKMFTPAKPAAPVTEKSAPVDRPPAAPVTKKPETPPQKKPAAPVTKKPVTESATKPADKPWGFL